MTGFEILDLSLILVGILWSLFWWFYLSEKTDQAKYVEWGVLGWALTVGLDLALLFVIPFLVAAVLSHRKAIPAAKEFSRREVIRIDSMDSTNNTITWLTPDNQICHGHYIVREYHLGRRYYFQPDETPTCELITRK